MLGGRWIGGNSDGWVGVVSMHVLHLKCVHRLIASKTCHL